MLKMIINEETNKPIHINGITRNLDTGNINVHFVLSGTFDNGYTASDVENLASYEDVSITKVQLYDDEDILKMQVGSTNGKLVSLSETISTTGASGYFSMTM